MSKYIPVPEFRTERLILRGLKLEDAESYEQNFADFQVISQLAAVVPWPYPKGGAQEFLLTHVLPVQGKSKWSWGLLLKVNPHEIIGAIEVWREGKPENRGFWLGKKYWGCGLMSEALTPIMDFSFNELKFEKLILSNALGNIRSRRLKEKSGARPLGTEPASFVNPNYKLRELWELTKEDWLLSKRERVD